MSASRLEGAGANPPSLASSQAHSTEHGRRSYLAPVGVDLSTKGFTEDNVCGRTLLTIVARGSAIIAELHRLVELVPAPFKRNNAHTPPVTRYIDPLKRLTIDEIIHDFNYFKNVDLIEAQIEASESLKKADEEFCDSYIDILTRFYLTFESVQRYANDLNGFVLELEEQTFVGQTLESLLLQNESLQLLCEAYFLLGYMLITTDKHFEGGLRERLIVSYYRYSAHKSSMNTEIEDTCRLMRTTNFRTGQQQVYRSTELVRNHRPERYPESLFSRVGVNESIVNLLIAKLQSVDIYNQTVVAFPHPDHRSAALSHQASILYVLLYFCPNILNRQRARMREIADKFFYDNWNISIYMGDLVNLIDAWNPYRAARESLAQLLEPESTASLVSQYDLRFLRVHKYLRDHLKEGRMDDEFVLEQQTRVLNDIREANVLLRWMLLHRCAQSGSQLKLAMLVESTVAKSRPEGRTLCNFLLDLADLEGKFCKIYSRLLGEKASRVVENRAKALDTLKELVEIFNDSRPLRWIKAGANTLLAAILGKSVEALGALNFEQDNSRDLLIKLINEIASAQETYLDSKNLQVAQLFVDTRDSLMEILRSLSLSGDIKISLDSITDFSYAWRLMDDTFTPHMQQIIKDDPLKVYRIKSAFMKLASAFDAPLMRIQQVNSPEDLISVSQYYSTELVSYILDVMHVIPATILELLSVITQIQTESVMSEMPSKIPLDSLRNYALPEQRLRMLELTYKVSHYAESMMLMQDTTIGLVRMNSKQLLEEGIRRELVRRMDSSIQEVLQFPSGGPDSLLQTAQQLFSALRKLETVLNGYKRSFEYIQDYLHIYGLRMWQEELSRIVRTNVDLAAEALLAAGNSQDSDQVSQSGSVQSKSQQAAPVNQQARADPMRSSFVGRLLTEVLKITDPRSTVYDEQTGGWFEQKPQREKLADLQVFELVGASLGVSGLNGIDQLCSSLLMLELQRLDARMLSAASGNGVQSEALVEALDSLASIRQAEFGSKTTSDQAIAASRLFASALARFAPFGERLVSHLLRVGQLQLIRAAIACVATTKCRYEARDLFNCLETLNIGLLSTLGRCNNRPSQQNEATPSGSALRPDSEDAAVAANDDGCDGADDGWPDTTKGGSGADSANTNRRAHSAPSALPLQLDDSQLVLELANHLDWVGLSDPMSKIYTLALQASASAQTFDFRRRLVAMDLALLVLLSHCSRFVFSTSIAGFLPRQSRSFYAPDSTTDGQPLFCGILTLAQHCQPLLRLPNDTADWLAVDQELSEEPLVRLLRMMSLYVKLTLDQQRQCCQPAELSLELVNMILSMLELIRLSRRPANQLLAGTLLPEFVAETFQFTLSQSAVHT